jgi:hypothetical protein
VKPSDEIARAFFSLRRGEGHGKVLEWLSLERERIIQALIRRREPDLWTQGYLACLDDLLQQLSR